MRDVLECPLVLLRAMPLATSLELRVPGFEKRCTWTTSGRAADAAHAAGAAVWAPDEYEALALGVEIERVLVGDVVRWCERKTTKGVARFLIDARVVMGGAAGLVPYVERYDEVRSGGRYGRSSRVLVGKTARSREVGGVDALQRTTLTLGEVLARLGVELVEVQVHERARPKAATAMSQAKAATVAQGPAWAAI